MRFPFLPALLGLVGLWFLASAATENGLLPSGHGIGRIWEVIIGLALVFGAAFRIKAILGRN